MNPAMVVIGAGVMLTAALVPVASAGEAPWPARSIRIVVPYPAGGGTDIVARLLGQKMSERLGATFVVENRAGGNTIIGTEVVARAKPDGYTLGLVTITHAVNASQAKLPFDPVTDFAPVMLVSAQPLVLVVHPSVPVRSVTQLIALARSRPGQVTFASSGEGGAPHLAGELLKKRTGLDLTHVPYKGAAPATVDVVGGHVTMMFSPVLSVVPHVRGGRLTTLAVSTVQRVKVLPDLPTMEESGVRPFDVSSWNGMLFPAGTPAPIVERINAALQQALELPDVREKMTADGAEIAGGSPAQFAAFIRREIDTWAAVLGRPRP